MGTQTTDATGSARFAAVLPGELRVTVTRALAGDWTYVPLTFDVSIPPGGGGVTLDVPLTRPGGVISGRVTAVGANGGTVPLPAGVRVAAEYRRPSPAARGATITSVAALPTVAVSPDATGSFVVMDVAPGTHVLTFTSTDAACAAPAAEEVVITELVCVVAPDATYRRA